MNITDAKKMITEVFHHNYRKWENGASHRAMIVPALVGDPGVGKTAACQQAAEELEMPYHQTIVGQMDAGEMGGFGFPMDVDLKGHDGKTYNVKRLIRLRPDFLPDPLLEDGVLGFYNLDELAQAPMANLNVCSQLVNEWRIGKHEISPGITIVCTMNKASNKAGTTALPSHLKERLCFVTIEPDYKEVMTLANRRGWHPLVISYLNKNPAHLHQFVVGQDACPTPRSWDKSSEIMSLDVSNHIRAEMLTGQIGAAMMTTFEKWLRVEQYAADPHQVIANPLTHELYGPDKIDILYLLITNFAAMADKKNIAPMIEYMKRIENQEICAIFTKDVLDRHPELNNTKAMTDFKIGPMNNILQ